LRKASESFCCVLLVVAGVLFTATLQAQAPAVQRTNSALLGPPEETIDTHVDEFWIEPRISYVIPRPAFGDVIAVDLTIEYPNLRPTLDAMEVPMPPEHVAMTDAISPRVMSADYLSLCSAMLGQPSYPPSPRDAGTPPSARTVQHLETFPAVNPQPAPNGYMTRNHKERVLTEWSTPLLTPRVRPASPPAPKQTVLQRTYEIVTWPIRRVGRVMNHHEDYYHIYPANHASPR
jgi:hypothetical protein